MAPLSLDKTCVGWRRGGGSQKRLKQLFFSKQNLEGGSDRVEEKIKNTAMTREGRLETEPNGGCLAVESDSGVTVESGGMAGERAPHRNPQKKPPACARHLEVCLHLRGAPSGGDVGLHRRPSQHRQAPVLLLQLSLQRRGGLRGGTLLPRHGLGKATTHRRGQLRKLSMWS